MDKPQSKIYTMLNFVNNSYLKASVTSFSDGVLDKWNESKMTVTEITSHYTF